MYAEKEAQLLMDAARNSAELAAMVEQRVAGRPLEYVVGWAEFDGLRIAVGAGAFVPRQRTVFLVQEAARRTRRGAVVVDLGCGTGALGAAVAARVGGVELHVCDIDPREVAWARRNVTAAGGQVYVGDLFEPLPQRLEGHIDTLLANVPYVPAEAIECLPAEARLYEPRVALDGGHDGLEVLRRVTAEAAVWLAPGGCLYVEVSAGQVAGAVAAFTSGGLTPQVVCSDALDATIIVGTAV